MAIITVTNNADTGAGSLRAAIAAANAGDQIVFASSLSGSTITVTTPLVLSKNITINGAESIQNVVVSGGGTTTVFDVTGSSVTLQNLAIANGDGVGSSSPIQNGGDAAGGIFLASGSLNLASDTFINNTATGGAGGLGDAGGSAAGAYYVEPGATVLAAGLSFFGNSATGGAPGPGSTTSGIGYPITNTPACFCPGTLITTERGDVPVERLAIGDRVLTLSGAAEPIRWIGRRSYAGRFLVANPAVKPVVIRAGALGGGLPRRDLRVSPCHAMYLDGVLVPASALVNGATITIDRDAHAVEYLHIELARHDVILAEGAASETYLDDDNRGIFHNAAEFAAHVAESTPATEFFARRVDSGFELERIRAKLAAIHGEIAVAA